KLYAPRLNELAKKYAAAKVAFVAVAPNRHDTPADLARFVRQHAVSFPVLKDDDEDNNNRRRVAARFGARRSPEAFVLDRARRVVYRGRIDDQYAVGVQKPHATRTELSDALDAVLAGREVAVPVTTAPGCPLERANREEGDRGVTYSRDVAPLFQK